MITYSPNNFVHANTTGENQIMESSVKRLYHKVKESPYSIKIALSGKEHYKVDSKMHTISPGNFLLVNSGEALECTIDSRENVKGKCIYIDDVLINDFYNSIVGDDIFIGHGSGEKFNVVSGKYNFDDSDQLSSLLNWFTNSSSIMELEDFYNELSFQLVSQQIGMKQVLSRLNAVDRSTQLELFNRAKLAKAYIHDNYFEDIGIDDISKEACISKFHLIRVFKKIYGVTPYNMLIKTRLSKASDLLKNKNLSIGEIALIAGFKQRRTFTRSFKKEFGVCPSDKIN